jgi:hypothetical protein
VDRTVAGDIHCRAGCQWVEIRYFRSHRQFQVRTRCIWPSSFVPDGGRARSRYPALDMQTPQAPTFGE